ncbi:hypothetical protein QUF74_17105 [Candidatus Halobeggiatoa sp. HSG11]|nr:hypothetical protein [Candidatus Halobeggiatoa sp. HSG11]
MLPQIKLEIDRNIKRIDAILPDIQSWLPLKTEDLNDTEIVKTIDSFIYRFTKIQDKMGEKLFPAVLKELQEYKSNMPLIDVLNKLEKLELIDNVDTWIDFRKLRNSLTHDYPNNETEIIEAINLSITAYFKMKDIYIKMLKTGGTLAK